ncbi:MAG: hypothetical protein RI995_2080 [Bacteroidota bacterium]
MNTKNLNERAELVTKVILATEELYHQGGLTNGQLGLLQTLIGAAIWYLPNDNKMLFTGKVSKALLEALESGKTEVKATEEHYLPRKISAAKLYEKHVADLKNDPENALKALYLEQFGKFNLVLKKENDQLKKHQKIEVFENPETAYAKAGIELVDLTPAMVAKHNIFKKYVNN